MARTRRGSLLIFRKERGGTLKPLYLLKNMVVLPPRLRLGETLLGNLPYFERKAIDAFEQEFDL